MVKNVFEIYTAITNLIIFIVASVIFFKIKNNRYFKLFYLLIAIAGFMGVIIHGVAFSPSIIKLLWAILSFIFSLIINLLLIIFINNKKYTIKHVILLSIVLYIIFFVESILKIDFLLTFIIYALIVIIILFYLSFKNKMSKFIIIGLIVQILGGIFQFYDNFHIYYFDNNGIYHIALLVTIAMFYLDIKKD